ncbi:MAG: polymerase sigma factor, sigma-70 family [Nevskia sp.]|nr:polymerase sigma factor, sigma-70 family [Nevskia sp.]
MDANHLSGVTIATFIHSAEAGLTAAATNSVTEPEDLALARQAARGDLGAFEQLYRTHVGRVYGLCCRLCDGDKSRADAATQDAFVRAWEHIGSFRGDARFSTWLHRLTVNVVLGEKRLLKRWVSFEEQTPGDYDDEDSQSTAAQRAPFEDVGLRMDLERAVARLPKGARTVLFLHDVEGYQHDEIAELTGIAVGTSKAQLHRARRLLKEWLQ